MVSMRCFVGVRVGSCTEKEALIVAEVAAGRRRYVLSDPFGEVGECNGWRNWRSVSLSELVEHQNGL
jgi:hypothetical protein